MYQTNSTHDIAALEQLYTEAEQCDADIFTEMRSNLLLIAGEHYNRRKSDFFRRIRDSKDLSEQQKLRLTKNHIQKIHKLYANQILAMAPGVGFEPKNESELQDQKKAELHHAVWRDAVERYRMDEAKEDEVDDFLGIGEVHTKIFWDPMGGKLLGNYQEMDPETGEPMFDEAGQPVRGEAVYEGEMVFEQIHGFNLLRSPDAKDFRKSEYLIIRKMVSKDELIRRYPEQKGKILESEDRTAVVFDGAKGSYRKANNEVLVKEYYFRPCPQYPQGYFYLATREAKLEEGPLPGGIFPIASGMFEKIQTTPRGRSPVKVMRPYQAEINRASSKMAEHQITLGDDKILLQNGTKISAGVALPGIRSVNYTGMEPKILAGRDGSQYLAYMQAQILELYQVMGVEETALENTSGQMDPYAMLFKSASQKLKFNRYVKRFERYLIDKARIYIQLAKIHLPDNAFIAAVGRDEQVNMAEFRSADDLGYEIKLSAQAEDLEQKFGKQMILNHALQYVGNKLEKEDIGKIMRAMPYANGEEMFNDFTMDYDCAVNDILALDRGEQTMVNAYDNHPYMIKKLTARVRMADFKFLPEEIQMAYAQKIQAHMQAETLRARQVQAAQADFIPTSGYMVVCDLYVPDAADPSKTKRARVPYEALRWLIQRLQDQGSTLEELEDMNQGALAQMAQISQQRNGRGDGMPPALQ